MGIKGLPEINRLQPRRNLGEMGSTSIVLHQGAPVYPRPFLTVYQRLPDLLVVFALDLNRHRQPLHPLRRLYLVAVAPVAAGVLHVVVEDELIHRGDHVEIPLPWDIV